MHDIADGRVVRVGPRYQVAERTPEVVLRAMLRAYETEVIDANITMWKEAIGDPRFTDLFNQANRALTSIAPLLYALVYELANRGDPLICLGPESRLGLDYKSRLAGTRPLDAPPLEVL